MDKINLETEINAPKNNVWSILSDFGGIHKWASGITDSKEIDKPGTKVGTERTLENPQLGTLREKIIEWNEGKGLKYEITPIPNTPVRSANSNWEISEQGDRSIVYLTSEFDLDGSKEQNQEFLKHTTDFLYLMLQDLKLYVEKQ